MKQMWKDTLILFVITLISGLALGAVYLVTKEPIAAQQEKKKANAYHTVFEDADSFEDDENFDAAQARAVLDEADGDYSEEEITMIASAFDQSGELLGYVVTVTTHAGYGGDITFSVGIRLDGTINAVSITEISETAGLGMKAPAELAPQFAGKTTQNRFTVTKTGATYPSEIDAISGATITSNAVTDGVNAGAVYCRYIMEQSGMAADSAGGDLYE